MFLIQVFNPSNRKQLEHTCSLTTGDTVPLTIVTVLFSILLGSSLFSLPALKSEVLECHREGKMPRCARLLTVGPLQCGPKLSLLLAFRMRQPLSWRDGNGASCRVEAEPFPLSSSEPQNAAGRVHAHVSAQQRNKREAFGHKPRKLSGNCKPSSSNPLEM